MGVAKAKDSKGNYEAKLAFRGGGGGCVGGGGPNQENPLRGTDIFLDQHSV